MTLDLFAFLTLIALHLRWAYKETKAEKQRDSIRKDLLATLGQIVDAQNEMRPMICGIADYIRRMDRD